MLKGKFPKTAEIVLKTIRKEVARSKTLPILTEFENLRWKNSRGYESCSLGMLPGTRSRSPTDISELPKQTFTAQQVIRFYVWFDRQNDAKAVVDFIWPQKKKKFPPKGKK